MKITVIVKGHTVLMAKIFAIALLILAFGGVSASADWQSDWDRTLTATKKNATSTR